MLQDEPRRERRRAGGAQLRTLSLALTLATGACAGGPAGAPADGTTHVDLCADPDAAATTVGIRYLGVGGFLIRHGDAALLTAPFYSNPGFLRVLLGRTIGVVDERVPARPDALEDAVVHGILVGHAHYDHLMDVRAVIEKWELGPVPVYGSRTAGNLLRAATPAGEEPPHACEVNSHAGTWRRPGTWHVPRAPGEGEAGGCPQRVGLEGRPDVRRG